MLVASAYIAEISLVRKSDTLPSNTSEGLGRSPAILRCAINLIAVPSPTQPATISVCKPSDNVPASPSRYSPT